MTTERDEGEGGTGAGPEDRRALPGNQTMQLDAMSDEIFEDLDARYPSRPPVAPPPLPRRRLWTAPAIAALVGVVIVAVALALLASSWLFGAESAPVSAPPEPEAPVEEAEVIPVQLDEIVIESGGGEEGKAPAAD